MLYEMACQAAWDRKIVYFKITRGKDDFLFWRRRNPDEQILSKKNILFNNLLNIDRLNAPVRKKLFCK